jgi:glycosyltransferase involved in cell wall biosynthesis
MRLWYLFYCDNPDGGDALYPNDLYDRVTSNRFIVESLPTEGFFHLVNRLVEDQVVDNATIVVDDVASPGWHSYNPKLTGLAGRNMMELLPMIRPEDIVMVRGGFKSWFPFLTELRKRNNWILFYRANTNRGKWLFWDVVLDDLREQSELSNGRLHLAFKKPTNERLFYPEWNVEKKYDFCVGASHIHDKKGQYLMIDLLVDMAREGVFPKCVMPGAVRHSTYTNSIMEKIEQYKLNVETPGMVGRERLRRIYNESKLLVHLGPGGQNDRAVLEALACGTPCVISNPKAFSPCISSPAAQESYVVSQMVPGKFFWQKMAEFLANAADRNAVGTFYLDNMAVEKAVMNQMRGLFDLIKHKPRGFLIDRTLDDLKEYAL